MLTGALIGLGVLSAGYAMYRGHKSDKQIDRANDINYQASQLNYQAQKETNDLNYQIFQEAQQYNSPAHLKEMYDALGLNGSAIVANQGFTPTSAPQMVAPQYDQVSALPYNQVENPADALASGLMSALTSEQMRAEIDKTIQERTLIEAQTSSCKASTDNLIKDGILKDLDIQLKDNDVQTINERNAQLRILTRTMQMELDSKPAMQRAILRQYDDRHAVDVADEICKKLNIEYQQKSMVARVKSAFVKLSNEVRQGKSIDLSNVAAEITNDILVGTKSTSEAATNADNRAKISEAEARSVAASTRQHEEVREQQKIELRDESALGDAALIFETVADCICSPISKIAKALK